jgi:hypothetical protein
MALSDRLSGLRERYERLSQRERTLVAVFFGSFAVLATLTIGLLITDGLASLGEENQKMREALSDIATHRDSYLKAKARVSQVESKLAHEGFALGGYVEGVAKEAGIKIPETDESPPAPVGKGFVEKTLKLRLTAVKLDALASFLRRVETGPTLVVVRDLNIRTRDDKHQELDVELTVATWEHAPKGAGKKDKDKDKDKG